MVDERCVEFFNIIGALLPLRLPLRTNYTNSWNTVSWCYHRSQVSLKFGVVFKFYGSTHPPYGWNMPIVMVIHLSWMAWPSWVGNVKQGHCKNHVVFNPKLKSLQSTYLYIYSIKKRFHPNIHSSYHVFLPTKMLANFLPPLPCSLYNLPCKIMWTVVIVSMH